MAKFLEGNVRKTAPSAPEEGLTPAVLRSLIPGDFHIMEVRPGQSARLEGMKPCFVLFHEKGIFVISRCKQEGIIHGELGEESWTSFNYLGDGTPFPNPAAQSRANIAALSRLLKLPEDAFHACILFPPLSELRKVPEHSPWLDSLLEDELEDCFSRMLPGLQPCYTHTQLDALRDIFLLVTSDTAN